MRTAYGKFREKWDSSLPPEIFRLEAIDFQKLRVQDTDFSEYERPLPHDEWDCTVY